MVGVSVEIDARADPSVCRNCGRYVTDQFRRVYGDNDGVTHRCGECDSYRRLPRGSTAGVDVSIPDPEVVDGHHGGESPVLAAGRGQDHRRLDRPGDRAGASERRPAAGGDGRMSGPVDPCDLPTRFSPDYVEARDQLAFVADGTVDEAGWARLTEWDGGKVLLPPRQCGKARFLETERVNNELRRRLAADGLGRDARSTAESDETEREPFADGRPCTDGADPTRCGIRSVDGQLKSVIQKDQMCEYRPRKPGRRYSGILIVIGAAHPDPEQTDHYNPPDVSDLVRMSHRPGCHFQKHKSRLLENRIQVRGCRALQPGTERLEDGGSRWPAVGIASTDGHERFVPTSDTELAALGAGDERAALGAGDERPPSGWSLGDADRRSPAGGKYPRGRIVAGINGGGYTPPAPRAFRR